LGFLRFWSVVQAVPEIPGCNASVGFPRLSNLVQLVCLWQFLEFELLLHRSLQPVVAHGEYVHSGKAEHEEPLPRGWTACSGMLVVRSGAAQVMRRGRRARMGA